MILKAGVLIKKDGKYLLVQEGKGPAYGLWNLPGGHVDKGETIKKAAKREGEEETGLKLNIRDEVSVTEDKYVEYHIFTAEIISGEIEWDKKELLDVKWFTPQEIQHLNLRWQPFKELFV